ncbi:MAG TPA: hypothetical protein VMV94_07425 [Phycisphaerae bacterium]|nr:hypothetical protein [Phycisphaerae bacterium]
MSGTQSGSDQVSAHRILSLIVMALVYVDAFFVARQIRQRPGVPARRFSSRRTSGTPAAAASEELQGENISEVAFRRWRREFGLKDVKTARRPKELEKEKLRAREDAGGTA